ncbi:unnamed protein product [Ostreobium quekettii]|uniref:Uncharacterized protein n=1 Tax=Ostreobium quekettii TaxID=121088 RepID=A0A8S1J7W2_9CHLO|nr:unnamed protein product [Ostreobium quekettii]
MGDCSARWFRSGSLIQTEGLSSACPSGDPADAARPGGARTFGAQHLCSSFGRERRFVSSTKKESCVDISMLGKCVRVPRYMRDRCGAGALKICYKEKEKRVI